jgi:hypothetical protein
VISIVDFDFRHSRQHDHEALAQCRMKVSARSFWDAKETNLARVKNGVTNTVPEGPWLGCHGNCASLK